MVRPWLKLGRSVSWRHGTAVSFFMFCWTCFYMPLMLCSGLTRFPNALCYFVIFFYFFYWFRRCRTWQRRRLVLLFIYLRFFGGVLTTTEVRAFDSPCIRSYCLLAALRAWYACRAFLILFIILSPHDAVKKDFALHRISDSLFETSPCSDVLDVMHGTVCLHFVYFRFVLY